MFATCDDGFIKSLVQLLKPQVLLRGDCAFKAYEAASTMYFIQNGCVQIVNHAQNLVHITLFSGAYFGELAMLTGQPRTATALAVTDCVLFYINQSDFNLVARKWPKALATILAKAKERMMRINNVNSQSLAQQLGERLHEVNQEMAFDQASSALGVPRAPASAASRCVQDCVAALPNTRARGASSASGGSSSGRASRARRCW